MNKLSTNCEIKATKFSNNAIRNNGNHTISYNTIVIACITHQQKITVSLVADKQNRCEIMECLSDNVV